MRVPWLKSAWKDFRASADPDELVAASGPAAIVAGPGALIAAILTLAYYPPLSRMSQMTHSVESSSLVFIGAALTYVAWQRKCRGFVGTLATLLDNAFYSAGLAVAAASSSGAMGIAMAVVHGLMIVAFPGRWYSITTLFALVMGLPVLGIIVVLRPQLPVGVVLVANLIIFLVVSQQTRAKRADQARQRQLEQALGAADRLADESVQAALTTTLLTLGHFLHELRNYQTAIAANLEYVEASGQLEASAKDALAEAKDAQEGQADLLRKTIDDLRGRSSGGGGEFLLNATLMEVAAAEPELDMRVTGEEEFAIRGNAEHLRIVVLNLNRNALQAGAETIEYHLRGEASGTAARLTVLDDGPGILEGKRARLFDSFALSDKPGGSGLGLYLVRRYIELLGGTIQASEPGSLGGATFVVRLPALSTRS